MFTIYKAERSKMLQATQQEEQAKKAEKQRKFL